MNLRFYHCDICGKLIAVLSDVKIPTNCCGKAMQELIPNHTDGNTEKHVPVFSLTGNNVLVQVGSNPHPMSDDHSIIWIGLRTACGFQFKELRPGDSPVASFFLSPEDRVEAVYAYCNLHGLWLSDKETDI